MHPDILVALLSRGCWLRAVNARHVGRQSHKGSAVAADQPCLTHAPTYPPTFLLPFIPICLTQQVTATAPVLACMTWSVQNALPVVILWEWGMGSAANDDNDDDDADAVDAAMERVYLHPLQMFKLSQ